VGLFRADKAHEIGKLLITAGKAVSAVEKDAFFQQLHLLRLGNGGVGHQMDHRILLFLLGIGVAHQQHHIAVIAEHQQMLPLSGLDPLHNTQKHPLQHQQQRGSRAERGHEGADHIGEAENLPPLAALQGQILRRLRNGHSRIENKRAQRVVQRCHHLNQRAVSKIVIKQKALCKEHQKGQCAGHPKNLFIRMFVHLVSSPPPKASFTFSAGNAVLISSIIKERQKKSTQSHLSPTASKNSPRGFPRRLLQYNQVPR